MATLIYGATQQKATSNITVNYSRPYYTVTFDPNGGGLSTTGGITSKQVRLGDSYGVLPTPTKPGYVFLGWRGRNLININKIRVNNSHVNLTLNEDKSVYITNESNLTGESRIDCCIIEIESLVDGKYWFSFENVNYSNENKYPYIYASGHSDSAGGQTGVGVSINYQSNNTSGFFNCSTAGIQSGTYKIEIHLSNSGDYQTTYNAGYLSFSNLMLTKVDEGQEELNYEPYYIESNTIFKNIGDTTLTAEWGTSMGDTTNPSLWAPSDYISSFSCSGDVLTATSKNNNEGQAYLQQHVTLTAGTYKYSYDEYSYSGEKPYPVMILYDSTNGWNSVPGTALYGSQNGKKSAFFTFTSTHTCSFIVYVCVDAGSSPCTITVKGLRLIKVP